MDREEQFLQAYLQLCLEFNYYVGSCGCCSSPWISKREVDQDDGGDDDLAKHVLHMRGQDTYRNCPNEDCPYRKQHGSLRVEFDTGRTVIRCWDPWLPEEDVDHAKR